MTTNPQATAPGAAPQTSRQSVLDLVSLAQGWHERAVILRLLAFKVNELFGGESSEYLVKRISGAAHPASEAQVAAIASELRDAAAAAQEQAARILGGAVATVNEGRVPGLSGRWAVLVESSAIELEDLDACAERRARKPRTELPSVRGRYA